MPRKPKEEKIEISKQDYDFLMELANEKANETPTEDDNNKIQRIREDNEEIGDIIPDTDNSRWELDSHPIVLDVLRALRREIRQPDGQWRRPKGIRPMMNPIGQFDIASALSSYLAKDMALANITREEAHTHTFVICKSMIKLIRNKHRLWELEKPYFDHIMSIIENKVYFHLTRPVDEGEKKYRTQRMPFRETYSHDEVNPNELGYGSPSPDFYKKDSDKTITM